MTFVKYKKECRLSHQNPTIWLQQQHVCLGSGVYWLLIVWILKNRPFIRNSPKLIWAPTFRDGSTFAECHCIFRGLKWPIWLGSQFASCSSGIRLESFAHKVCVQVAGACCSIATMRWLISRVNWFAWSYCGILCVPILWVLSEYLSRCGQVSGNAGLTALKELSEY